jgi:predicted GTPase
MKADASNEQQFIADVDAFEFITQDVTTIVRSMQQWLARLRSQLESNRLTCDGLNEHSELVRKADAINAIVIQSMANWTAQWQGYEPVRAFANSFDDKLLLLVFGKFNAGKSSFCNLLADRFAAHGKDVRYFYLDGGKIVETRERFGEGVTETTSRLQGVRLAQPLILVDTPGLHSVTPENAALTQRFADSADGVLWLTSSTSPGQVQELDELARELHRNKPLLPVVTRSDVYEEDELDGAICKVLRAKTPENRAEQEADVQGRAADKLLQRGVSVDMLKPPVSISTHLARALGTTQTAMTEGGFERLFAALLAITETTLAYKRRKQAEVLLHHLEENVIAVLDSEVASLLRELRRACDRAKSTLEETRAHIAKALWRAVIPRLPTFLDDPTTIDAQLSACTRAALKRAIEDHLCDYDINLDMIDTQLEAEEQADYQRLCDVLAAAFTSYADAAVDQCRAALLQLDVSMQSLERLLSTHEDELRIIKHTLRRL